MKHEDAKKGEQDAFKAKLAEQAKKLPGQSKRDDAFRQG